MLIIFDSEKEKKDFLESEYCPDVDECINLSMLILPESEKLSKCEQCWKNAGVNLAVIK